MWSMRPIRQWLPLFQNLPVLTWPALMTLLAAIGASLFPAVVSTAARLSYSTATNLLTVFVAHTAFWLTMSLVGNRLITMRVEMTAQLSGFVEYQPTLRATAAALSLLPVTLTAIGVYSFEREFETSHTGSAMLIVLVLCLNHLLPMPLPTVARTRRS